MGLKREICVDDPDQEASKNFFFSSSLTTGLQGAAGCPKI